jgi:transcriptional/translational regulatory protein YebC/TACO1
VIASIKGSAKIWYRSQPRISEITTNERDIQDALSYFQDEGYHPNTLEYEDEMMNDALHSLALEDVNLEHIERAVRSDDEVYEVLEEWRSTEDAKGNLDELTYRWDESRIQIGDEADRRNPRSDSES